MSLSVGSNLAGVKIGQLSVGSLPSWRRGVPAIDQCDPVKISYLIDVHFSPQVIKSFNLVDACIMSRIFLRLDSDLSGN